jgi:putative ABC transport system permease protein
VGKYIKVNDTWGRIGCLANSYLESRQFKRSRRPQITLHSAEHIQYRFWDNNFSVTTWIYRYAACQADSIGTAKVVTAILNSTHHNIPDFSVIIPACWPSNARKPSSLRVVAIAAISLLVGGIGIMNIVLATVMERTREIGVRRATGARRNDIVRQFLTESVLISVAGGMLGIAFGYLLSWLIARTAEWKTIVTSSSIVIAFGVSVAVGVIFGIYPAVKASRIDPIEALRYE